MEKFLYKKIDKNPLFNVWLAYGAPESVAMSSLGYLAIFKDLDLNPDLFDEDDELDLHLFNKYSENNRQNNMVLVSADLTQTLDSSIKDTSLQNDTSFTELIPDLTESNYINNDENYINNDENDEPVDPTIAERMDLEQVLKYKKEHNIRRGRPPKNKNYVSKIKDNIIDKSLLKPARTNINTHNSKVIIRSDDPIKVLTLFKSTVQNNTQTPQQNIIKVKKQRFTSNNTVGLTLNGNSGRVKNTDTHGNAISAAVQIHTFIKKYTTINLSCLIT